MDPHLLSYAERPAPRYTSYPSADHFDTSVDANVQSAEDWRRAAIIQSIMCDLEIDLAPWGGWDMFPDAYVAIAQLAAEGIVELRDCSLRIPPSMRQFSRLVAMTFDAYSSSSITAHSRAI